MSNLFPQEFTAGAAKAEATTEAGFYATTADMTVYVATTGSDTTGDGTVGNPYATVERAYSDIPRVIRHECKILVAAGDYASGLPRSIAPDRFEAAGSLAVIGVGVPTVVSGPWTITGVAALGTAGHTITVGAGGLGADDSLCGQAILITSETATKNKAYYVVANTDTTITIVYNATPPLNADTFNLVVPAVKIAADSLYLVLDKEEMSPENTWGTGTRLVLHNLYLDFSASPLVQNILTFKGTSGQVQTGIYTTFVVAQFPVGAWAAVVFNHVQVSAVPPIHDCLTDGSTEILNTDSVTLSCYGNPNRTTRMAEFAGDCRLLNVHLFGGLVSMTQIGRIQCVQGSVGSISSSTSGVGYTFYAVLAVGKAGAVCLDASGPDLRLEDVHVMFGTNALRVGYRSPASNTYLRNVTCDPVGVTLAAMNVGPGCMVTQRGALANFVGASAGGDKAYVFAADVAVKSDTWLAASGNSVTDAKGAFITRLD